MLARAFVWSVVLLLVAATSGPRAVRADAADASQGKTPIHRTSVEAPATGHARPAGSAGTTLVLLGLLLAGAIIARRVVQQRVAKRSGTASHHPVRLVSRQQIDSELNIRLLQIGPRLLVVAATPQGVATLSEITDPEEIALLTGEAAATLEPAALFAGNAPITTGNDLSALPHRPSMPPTAGDRWTSRVPQPVQAGE
jgi:flagellar biogenesis protein FliO